MEINYEFSSSTVVVAVTVCYFGFGNKYFKFLLCIFEEIGNFLQNFDFFFLLFLLLGFNAEH